MPKNSLLRCSLQGPSIGRFHAIRKRIREIDSQYLLEVEKLYQLYGPMTLDNPLWMEWILK